jgi:DNA-binding CsgD family transcriptional regulator
MHEQPGNNSSRVQEPTGKCPACGASEAIGCEEPLHCIQIMTQLTQTCVSEIVGLIDGDPNDRPFRLLMASYEALDLVNVGLAVIDRSGHLMIANCTAEQIFADRDGLELTPGGEVRFSKHVDPSLVQLVRYIDNPLSSETPTKSAFVAVTRPSGKRPITLLVRPARAESLQATQAAPAALMVLLDPEFSVDAAEAQLRELYGLTSTEARLAKLLMDGKTIEECCSELGVRSSTARMHVRNLFQKTGVRRQSQLISLLLKSIGLIRTADAKPGVNGGDSEPREKISASVNRVLETMKKRKGRVRDELHTLRDDR